MSSPLICFGQQPCGFLPRRFLHAKFVTARRLQREIGGEIVFFYHDSDHDPRETQTILRHRTTEEPLAFNFGFINKLQRKYSPLYLKGILPDWQANTARQLPAYLPPELVAVFKRIQTSNVADFCLSMYRELGYMEGVRVARSSDPEFRRSACAIDDCFVDVAFQGERVRARRQADGSLQLHEGGSSYLTLPACDYDSSQVSPTRDTRLRWMQSVLHCTHYICGAGEKAYLNPSDAPEIQFVERDPIDRSDEAYVPSP